MNSLHTNRSNILCTATSTAVSWPAQFYSDPAACAPFFNCKHYSFPHDLFQNFFYSYWSFPFSISGDLLKGFSWHASNPSKILDSDTSFVQSNFCHLFWQFVKFKAVFVSNFDRPAAPLVLISVFLDKFFINFVKKWITNFIY